MSLFDYRQSREVSASGYTFSALIMAAMRQADSFSAASLRAAFPDVARELQARYDAPGGLLPGETAPEDFAFNSQED